MGTGCANKLISVHDVKTELLKLNTKKITMTLDCCRKGGKGGRATEEAVMVTGKELLIRSSN